MTEIIHQTLKLTSAGVLCLSIIYNKSQEHLVINRFLIPLNAKIFKKVDINILNRKQNIKMQSIPQILSKIYILLKSNTIFCIQKSLAWNNLISSRNHSKETLRLYCQDKISKMPFKCCHRFTGDVWGHIRRVSSQNLIATP